MLSYATLGDNMFDEANTGTPGASHRLVNVGLSLEVLNALSANLCKLFLDAFLFRFLLGGVFGEESCRVSCRLKVVENTRLTALCAFSWIPKGLKKVVVELKAKGMTSTSSVSTLTPASAVDEALFLSQIEALRSLPVVFSDSYQAPPNLWPSRIPVLGNTLERKERLEDGLEALCHSSLEVLPPPEKKAAGNAANLAGTHLVSQNEYGPTSLPEVLNVTFKSLKPAYSVTLPIQPADNIQALKSTLTSQASSPLTNSTLRLLLKGKALLDSKLVKDYDIKDGSVINVMATAAPPSAPAPPANASMDLSAADRDPVPAAASPNLGATSPSLSAGGPPGHKRRISDIPAVTLSPAGTPAATTPLLQPVSLTADPLTHLPLTPPAASGAAASSQSPPSPATKSIPLDLASIPLPTASSQSDSSPFHQTMASPTFWKELRGFLEVKFGKEAGGRTGDGDAAFEEFLRSAKGSLSPHEIAKIRDEVGISGMGGH
ncbi:hypothetical protein M408DRAFT_8965 [Serendipita vermifera MAFF 305830]|uniref:Ubiquitin-like domain-containing protein n=1 Tax=Serendipita vermifera MAFF 305830 TaxID=933852 RepID=A0A0C3B973_SERVB|nr:hypothetical protein M408DRAFT_8965 [Serendipita vermifera MAFF 305830]